MVRAQVQYIRWKGMGMRGRGGCLRHYIDRVTRFEYVCRRTGWTRYLGGFKKCLRLCGRVDIHVGTDT